MYGLQACTPNLEHSIHMTDDIVRHSTLDNYWCYVYERLIQSQPPVALQWGYLKNEIIYTAYY